MIPVPNKTDANALDAVRQEALDRWRSRHGVSGRASVGAMIEAASIAQLVATDEGPCFEPDAFGELVTFIAELPF